jgi:hypothetical protein
MLRGEGAAAGKTERANFQELHLRKAAGRGTPGGVVVTASVFYRVLTLVLKARHSCSSGLLGGGGAVDCFACATDLKGEFFEWMLIIVMMAVMDSVGLIQHLSAHLALLATLRLFCVCCADSRESQVDLNGREVDRSVTHGELLQQPQLHRKQELQQLQVLQPRKSKVVADARKSPNIWATGMA